MTDKFIWDQHYVSNDICSNKRRSRGSYDSGPSQYETKYKRSDQSRLAKIISEQIKLAQIGLIVKKFKAIYVADIL